MAELNTPFILSVLLPTFLLYSLALQAQSTDKMNAPTYSDCTASGLPDDIPSAKWRQTRSKVLTHVSSPNHTARDLVTTPNRAIDLRSKFSYGAPNKDLEDETIGVWLSTCSGNYRFIGKAITSHDGRIQLALSKSDVPTVGRYSLYYRVLAGEAGVKANLRVLPKGTKFVVFDIDETLSSGGTMRTVWEVVWGSNDELPRPGAVGTANKRYDQGYQLVYLTARPYIVTEHTRQWLSSFDFPPGTLRLVQDTSETIVSHAGRE